MFWNEADIDTMLAGLGGVQVVHGSETGLGVLDSYDANLLATGQTSQVGKVYSLQIKSSAFPTVKGGPSGSSITVGGTAYTVRDRLALDDGALTQLLLQR